MAAAAFSPGRHPKPGSAAMIAPRIIGQIVVLAAGLFAGLYLTPALAAEISGLPRARPQPPQSAQPPLARQRPARPPDQEAACRRELAAQGAAFEDIEPITGNGACGVSAALRVSRITQSIDLRPAADMNCQTALALARWVNASVVPAAREFLSAGVSQIGQNSTYVCRGRNNVANAKISEHAYGNAVDVARIGLDIGREFIIGSDENSADDLQFQRTIRDQACQYFTTVLGPGSDAHHTDHFHLDLAPRRRGYRYCR